MMRLLALYTAVILGANAAWAGPVDPALLTGDMQKLVLETEAAAVPELPLLDMADGPRSLAEYKDRWMVLNFWATWCVPCRTEMPALDRLQAARPDITVVTVATGPNPKPAITRFLAEAGVASVTVLRDPESTLAHGMGVLGLPVTVIVAPGGVEVARLIGGAEWDSAEAQAVLAALIGD